MMMMMMKVSVVQWVCCLDDSSRFRHAYGARGRA